MSLRSRRPRLASERRGRDVLVESASLTLCRGLTEEAVEVEFDANWCGADG